MCVNGLPYCGGCGAGKWSMRPKVITLIRKLIVVALSICQLAFVFSIKDSVVERVA